MINGRVERCADNIMRRIVLVRDPRGPSALSRGAFWGPTKFRRATEKTRVRGFYLDFPGTAVSRTEPRFSDATRLPVLRNRPFSLGLLSHAPRFSGVKGEIFQQDFVCFW